MGNTLESYFVHLISRRLRSAAAVQMFHTGSILTAAVKVICPCCELTFVRRFLLIHTNIDDPHNMYLYISYLLAYSNLNVYEVVFSLLELLGFW